LVGGVRVFLFFALVREEKLRGFAAVLARSGQRVVASVICGVLGVGNLRVACVLAWLGELLPLAICCAAALVV
jgi:hypothetical protein